MRSTTSLAKSLPISQQALDAMMAEAVRTAQQWATIQRMSTRRQFELRGNNALVQTEFSEPTFLVGAAGTGKTLAWCKLVNALLWKYPQSRGLMVRKVRKDLTQSAMVTFERDVLGLDNPICSNQQRDNRTSYRYPNGSELVVAGLDRPGAALSAEYDFIYMVEAVEFDENDFETLDSRKRNFYAPTQMIFGDTNPAHPQHWLKQAGDAGRVRLLNSYHKDNPKYWDAETGEWTREGLIYVMGTLANLSGLRKQRYYDGIWAQAEGIIYEEWREDVHVVDAARLRDWGIFDDNDHLRPENLKTVIAGVDWGYTNPGVIQVWAVDKDGRMILIHEVYRTRQLIDWWVMQAKDLHAAYNIRQFACDPSEPSFIETFKRAGLLAAGADNAVTPGIQAVQSRLKVQDDGRARLYVYRGASSEQDEELERAKKPTSVREEFPGYVWANKAKKEEPVKEDDHGLDTLRYSVMAVNKPREMRGQEENPFYG